ncbi:MAG TPA: carboxyl transferase domain-containing protein, partial [Bacteroidia bacterium]|nr:carboxyl transferase domain-containing protein [Bacteroidia bacterium]
MDFFEHQEVARRKTHVLVLYFALAVAGIVVAVYALIVGILAFAGEEGRAELGRAEYGALWNPGLFLITAVGTGSVVFLASTGGGAVVARELGGRQLDVNTTDHHERRLLNLVEEMAIASGVPVPAVYVMDAEDSINAFAAGKTPSDAVIGVTRGCMTLLSRDELQGVIAHEFSHILNGDMRLNIRLMGLLFGILFLALVGEIILRSLPRTNVGSNRKEGAGIALVMFVAGLGLFLIGSVGAFFANLIKASVSRQREFLADASAVQFTRNPDGIAGALKKIGGLSAGSQIANPMAKDASHLFFGNAVSSQLFATHPPLRERIRRLLPHWDGGIEETAPLAAAPGTYAPSGNTVSFHFNVDNENGTLRLRPTEAIESLKTVHPEQVDLGRELHGNLPAHWLAACRSLGQAQGIVYALLLAQDDKLRSQEIDQLRRDTDEATARFAASLCGELASAHSTVKIGLLDLAIPTLRTLGREEYARFRETLHRLVESDGQVDLFEFMLLRLVTRHLDAWFEKRRPEPVRYRKLAPVLKETGILLSTLAAMSHPDDEATAEEAFAAARRFLSYLPSSVYGVSERTTSADPVDRRDEALMKVIPRDRKQVYRMRPIIETLFDKGSFFEMGQLFGRSIITGFARLNGLPVAVMASDPFHYGGAWTANACQKIVRFIDLAETFHLPVVHLADCPGFLIGLEAEKTAVIRHGVRAMAAINQTSVPWCTIIIRNVFGVAGAIHQPSGRFVTRYAWLSAWWGSLPLEGGDGFVILSLVYLEHLCCWVIG